ncbi:formylglycine-generating enzyme family protein [Vibrio sp. ZSDE26]|uniref:Formylglycine-generating enzyme family protein n=1 Tax=Vibrio amylolyticus TaxID=2847292 RepID=A0A9X1XNF8_9VIBR|nr:SUMF1/EgtB/PvdO family nonheme iron enzyme [Vibrio amylolyticus]MCK6265796.1 formylglycine-generating enzyme family protein [Vibrio amylolyticus]
MKNKWLGVIALVPVIGACSDTNWANKLSSDSVSQEQIETISNNIETLYPDASDELKYKAADVAVRAIENLVFVEGGSFEMGDFGMPCEVPSGTVNRIDWTPDVECLSSPTSVETGAVYLHDVTLDSYSMSAYETTFIDMEWMRQINRLPAALSNHDFSTTQRNEKLYEGIMENRGTYAASTKNWQDAKGYCLWLGDVTALPYDLPTEAQWEYAARNRGEMLYYATNTGYRQTRKDRYIDVDTNTRIRYPIDEVNASSRLEAVDRFPPNPLGIYGMANQVSEWVNDWYSPDYYQNTSQHNPQGPQTGEKKVRRNGGAMTFDRSYATPNNNHYDPRNGFRCSLQQTTAI